MSQAWYEIQKQQRELDRRLDEIAHKRAQEIIRDLRSPSYCMHTHREALQRLAQRHSKSFPSDEAKDLYQKMGAIAKENQVAITENHTAEITTRKQDFFKEYGIEEIVGLGIDGG